jgi:histidinol-phosphatase (PHP family)
MNAIPVFDGHNSWKHTLHTHSSFCDGKLAPETYAASALEKDMDILGFSSHAPIPYPPGADALGVFWCLKPDDIWSYTETINNLTTIHAGKLDIRLGLEIDYIPHVTGPNHPMFCEMQLDYSIGSVHAAGANPDGSIWTVDCKPDNFIEGIDRIFGGSVERTVREFYRRIREMVAEQPPDIIGHLDLIRKNNKTLNFLDESEKWYRHEVYETLEAVAASDCVIELNTGGMARGYVDQPYPSFFVLKRCRELHIPVMINSDAHHPDAVMAQYDYAVELLRKAGF